MSMLTKELFDIGFQQTKTYIQSGNIVLKTELTKFEVQNKIKDILLHKFSINTEVIVRTLEDVVKIQKSCPFTIDETNSKIKKLYVYFLIHPLEEIDWERLQKYVDQQNRYFADKDNVYLYCEEGISASQLATHMAKMKTSYTSRNWNTVCEVAKIATKMNEEYLNNIN